MAKELDMVLQVINNRFYQAMTLTPMMPEQSPTEKLVSLARKTIGNNLGTQPPKLVDYK